MFVSCDVQIITICACICQWYQLYTILTKKIVKGFFWPKEKVNLNLCIMFIRLYVVIDIDEA